MEGETSAGPGSLGRGELAGAWDVRAARYLGWG